MSGVGDQGDAEGGVRGGGYQPITGHGPRVRTDVVDVYVFKRVSAAGRARPENHFLQLLRSGPPLENTWHPVMGHIEKGETAVDCAVREMEEEMGIRQGDAALVGLWALEQVHPFYIAAIDTIVMSPRFAAEVVSGWAPMLNAEHGEYRWVREGEIDASFMWPGQKAACREILSMIVPGGVAAEHVRIRGL